MKSQKSYKFSQPHDSYHSYLLSMLIKEEYDTSENKIAKYRKFGLTFFVPQRMDCCLQKYFLQKLDCLRHKILRQKTL